MISKRENLPTPNAGRDYPRGEGWRESGLCRQVDPEDFHPRQGDHSAAHRAKSICQQCDVRTICLQWALDQREPHGVWGGLTERERRVLLREKAS